MLSETLARLGKLNRRINHAFFDDPAAFVDFAGTGVVVRGDTFPLSIRTNMSFRGDMDDGLSFSDAWGRPLNAFVIWHQTEIRNSGRGVYRIYVWSDGRNGRNEERRGDDISVSPTEIQVTQIDILERIRKRGRE